MARVLNLIIDQGTTFSANITAKDSDGVVRDLTNFTARAQLRRSYNSANSITFGANILVPASGNVTLSLTDAVTANLKQGRFVYDLELVQANTLTVERLVEGIVTVFPEVTR